MWAEPTAHIGDAAVAQRQSGSFVVRGLSVRILTRSTVFLQTSVAPWKRGHLYFCNFPQSSQCGESYNSNQRVIFATIRLASQFNLGQNLLNYLLMRANFANGCQ
jgi:hypothetical protein